MTQTPLGLYAYPWDVLDEGIDAVLDGVERAGLNTLYITTWYHSGMFFLPHNPKRRVHFPEPGALYYAPGVWHATHPLRPPISRLCDDWTGFWADLATAARARGIALAAWMPVLHNTGVGSAHPDVAVENAWGDVITHTLCPFNASVRDLVLHVMRDVAGMGIFDRVLMESIEYLPLRHDHHHEVIGVPLGPDIEFLASLCFAPEIMAHAKADGVDAERVRAWVRDTVDATLEGAPRRILSWAEIEAGADGQVGAYLRTRESGPSTLIAEAADTLHAAGNVRVACLDFGPLYPLGPNGRRWQNGVDLDRIGQVDELHPTFYQTDPAILNERIETYRATVGDRIALVPALRAVLPQTADADGLAAQTAAVASIASGVSYYNYSFMPLKTLDWINAAVSAHPPQNGGQL